MKVIMETDIQVQEKEIDEDAGSLSDQAWSHHDAEMEQAISAIEDLWGEPIPEQAIEKIRGQFKYCPKRGEVWAKPITLYLQSRQNRKLVLACFTLVTRDDGEITVASGPPSIQNVPPEGLVITQPQDGLVKKVWAKVSSLRLGTGRITFPVPTIRLSK